MRGRRYRMASEMQVESPSDSTLSRAENNLIDTSAYFERRVARLLIVMYYCGEATNSLLQGETRQIESLARLQQFDFWVREPGHLALALLHARAANPNADLLTGEIFPEGTVSPSDVVLRTALNRMLKDDLIDKRRIDVPWGFSDDLDTSLSFLTARSLASDRPSFIKSKLATHQVILEPEGVALVLQILKECPTFDWYRMQAEMVQTYQPILQRLDLIAMPYLAPELTPTSAASTPLSPFVQRRSQSLFGDFETNVDV